MQTGAILAHVDSAVPVPGWNLIWTGWELPVIPLVVSVAALGLYLRGVRIVAERHPRHPWPGSRTGSFVAGTVVLLLAVGSPIGAYDTILFWVHMVQHMLLMMVAAPLLALGAPYTLAVRAATPRIRRRVLLPLVRNPVVEVLTFPVVTFTLLMVVLYFTHFTSVFELALEDPLAHELEHIAYLAASYLFWVPVVGLEPTRWKLSDPAKLIYVFLGMPAMTFLGLALVNSRYVVYEHYATVARDWGPTPIDDQHFAGFLMWMPTEAVLLVTIILIVTRWLRTEERRASRMEQRFDAERAAEASPSTPA